MNVLGYYHSPFGTIPRVNSHKHVATTLLFHHLCTLSISLGLPELDFRSTTRLLHQPPALPSLVVVFFLLPGAPKVHRISVQQSVVRAKPSWQEFHRFQGRNRPGGTLPSDLCTVRGAWLRFWIVSKSWAKPHCFFWVCRVRFGELGRDTCACCMVRMCSDS